MADRKVQVIVDIVQSADGKRTAAKVVNDIESEVKASQKRIEASHKNTNKVIAESDKALTREQLNQEKILERSHKNMLRTMERDTKESASKMRSAFNSVFAGTFLGMGAFEGVRLGIEKALGGLQTAFQKSLDFSQAKTSIAQFEGSMAEAEKRINSLMKAAQQTPGLNFLSAVDGYKRLRSIGFEAEKAEQILRGMAKVRLLSGATKEDMDAMIVNFVQIANGGQTIQQELREMATRMPAIVGIIRKEFGSIGDELNDIDPKEFVSRLAAAMDSVRADANKTSVIIEDLQDSFDRWYIAVGSVIEQNPELQAALKLLVRDIDGTTDALNEQESATRRTYSSFVSWTGKALVSSMNLWDGLKTGVWSAGNIVAAAFSGMATAAAFNLSLIPKAVNKFIIDPLNAIKNHPAAQAFFPGGMLLPDIPRADTSTLDGMVRDYGTRTKFLIGDVQRDDRAFQQRRQNRISEFEAEVNRLRNAPPSSGNNISPVGTVDPTGKFAGGGNSGGGRGRVRAASNSDDRTFRDIQALAADHGFVITSTNRTKNTTGIHATGRAADIRVRGKSADEIGQFIAAALEKGFRVVDERTKIKGSPYWSGPHLHLEANNRRESTLFDSNSYGRIPIGMLREMDAKRFNKGRVTDKEIAKYVEDNALTTTSNLEGSADAIRYAIALREDQIEKNQKVADTYGEMAKMLYQLNEANEEEMFWLDVRLGKYDHLDELQQKQLGNIYAQIDAQKQAREAQREQEAADRERQNAIEETRRQQQQLFEETARGWEDLFHDLADGNFKSIWDRMRRQMLDAFIKPASQYMAALFGGVSIPGVTPQMAGAGGFGNIGFGGTPGFNPSMNFAGGGQAGQQGGGLFGNLLGGLFGGGKGGSSGGGGIATLGGLTDGNGNDPFAIAGKAGGGFGDFFRNAGGGSKMAGMASMGGMAASLIGGAIGGKWGNLLTMGGMGASIGANFGPWGALIGAAIGTGAGFISMLFGRDNAEKKLKEAAAAEFGINISDKSVLRQLKQLGEAFYGKGQAGKNASAIVRSEEGMNILRAYATSSGQSGLKIDRLNYGDENWSGNQFTSRFGGFRASGGSVASGFSYIVGERGPELFTPTRGGGNITSNADLTKMQAALADSLYQISEQLGRLQTMPADQVVMMGANGASSAINGAMQREYERGAVATEQTHRNTGAYY